MEKKFKLALLIALCLILGQGAFTLTWLITKPKTAYVNTEEIYNGFEMKKGLEAQLKKVQDARQNMLDSLRLQLDLLSMELQNKKTDTLLEHRFTSLRDYYFQRQDEMKQANDAMAQEYTGKIWTQLNQYIRDYGKQNNYQYIFGASGDGSLMFAGDAENITPELKSYVNNSYKGQP